MTAEFFMKATRYQYEYQLREMLPLKALFTLPDSFCARKPYL